MAIPYRTAKFKSANILTIANLGSTVKFNSRQYFLLYNIHVHTHTHTHPHTLTLSRCQPSYLPDYTVYTKPSTHVARLGNKIAQSFFTSENLRQDLLQRQTACLSFPVSEEGCPPEVDNYHSLCPLEPIDKTPPDQVRNG